MSKLKANIESRFEQFAGMVFDHRFKALIICLICWAALFPNLRHLEIDTSNESFLHESDPILIEYNDFRNQFGRDEVALITMKSKNGVFTLQFLEKLKALHEELADNVPHLDDITSLMNARYQVGKDDELLVEDFMETFPETQVDVELLKEKANTQPNYINLVLNKEMTVTTMVLKANTYTGDSGEEDALGGFDDAEDIAPEAEKEFLTQSENAEFVDTISAILNKYKSPDFEVYMAGSAVVTDSLKKWMMSDVKKFIRLCVLVIGIFLYIMFRRFSCVFLPLLIVLLTLASTISLMAISGIKFKLPTSILPSFVLAVGVGAAVHILTIVVQQLRKGFNKREAIVYAVGHSGLAVFLTSLTTAGGLLSFATAEVAPIAELGIFAATGVMISFVYTIVLIPALLSLTPFKARQKELEAKTGPSKLDNILADIGSFAVRKKWLVLTASFLIFLLALGGISKVRLSHNPLAWLPSTAEVTQGTLLTDKEMNGSVNMEVVVDTGKENGLHEPVLMRQMDAFDTFAEAYTDGPRFVGKASGLSDILKEINRALNENRDEYYSIPDNRQLIAQELLLFENSGSDDLEDFVDSGFQKARISLKNPWLDTMEYLDFIEFFTTKAKTYFKDANVIITGVLAIFARVMVATIHSMVDSYFIAAMVISLLMILLIGRLKLGLVSMIPNLFPIVVAIGIIGWFNLPLDLFTMMVGSIAIGLAVDDTIHFMHNFSRYFHQSGDVEQAVRLTLSSTGRAMLTTTLVLAAGFFIYMFAMMKNLYNFGMITAIAIILALLSDFFVAPALMGVFAKKSKDIDA